MPAKNTIAVDLWDHAQDDYELGRMNARQIGERLGVSRQTGTREMVRRGAVKASRVAETVVELNAHLDRKAAERRRREKEREAAAWERAEETMSVIRLMMEAITQANRAGNVTLAKGVIAQAAACIGGPKKSLSLRL